ncbi:hypothetical protein HK105_203666 [Polyrhizophydium stewartii]|uniref:Peptidase A1 domain-containing protein n=1 Tax=Polyrhizophydium stewartii TaxID=2732419 RepID=A0ABR4NBH5_9FUNG
MLARMAPCQTGAAAWIAYAVLLAGTVGEAVAFRVPLQPSRRRTHLVDRKSRIAARLPGGFETCFLMSINVQGVALNVMVDSGSTDLSIPNAGLNNYAGPAINATRPAGASTISASYGDQSGWSGFGFQGNVSITNTTIKAGNAPIIAMESQTSSPVYTDGSTSQGLIGLAYAALGGFAVTPATIMDAWYASGTLPSNTIGFHACPYGRTNESYIDFGNTAPSTKCNASGVPTVWAPSPAQTYFTIDIRNISVAGTRVALPSTFQPGSGWSGWSIVDSCTSVARLPGTVITALKAAIIASGGLPSDIQASQSTRDNFLGGSIAVLPANPFNWAALPNVTFEITSDQPTASGRNAPFSITMGAKQYIQKDSNGYYNMLFFDGGDTMAILGVPFFTHLFVLLDRQNGRVGFSPGDNNDVPDFDRDNYKQQQRGRNFDSIRDIHGVHHRHEQ